MLTVNELLDAAKAKRVNFEPGEIFMFRNLLKIINGAVYHLVTDYFLAPYFSIISNRTIRVIVPIVKYLRGKEISTE